jgi:phosphoribosylaminoimidazole-succinocarboxamide synthase
VEQYQVGSSPPSFDKQYLRDYLSSLGWDKKPPPPALPEEIVEKTGLRYQEALQRITS